MRKGKKGLLMLTGSFLTALLMIAFPNREMVEVEAAVIDQGPFVQTVLLSGVVSHRSQQPFITAVSGRVAQVFAEQGQEIRTGDLLFKLDTSAEEQALSDLYLARFAQKNALANQSEIVSAIALQNELEWRSLENQLLMKIASSQIRAASDGVMKDVYVQEGEWVQECSLLGEAHGTGIEFVASAYMVDTADIQVGATGVASCGDYNIPVRLSKKNIEDEKGIQLLYFEAVNEEEWSSFPEGKKVSIEAMAGIGPSCALIPLAAIDSEDRIWTIKNGKAYAWHLTPDEYGRTHASADPAWADKVVILYPDAYNLRDGASVRVKQ